MPPPPPAAACRTTTCSRTSACCSSSPSRASSRRAPDPFPERGAAASRRRAASPLLRMTNTPPPRHAIAFRPRRPDDGPFLRYLYSTTREDEMNRLPWSDAQRGEFLDQQFQAQTRHYDDFYPGAEFLLIELEGKAIGRLYLDRRDDEIEIIDIALVPEYR